MDSTAARGFYAHLGPLSLLVAAALFLVGCGGTEIDSAKTEGALQHNLEELHEKVESVSCPSGIEVEPGRTFTCSVKLAGGKEKTATLKIRDKEADLSVIRIEEGSGSDQ